MKQPNIEVLVPLGLKISRTEKEAAWILARHFRATIKFVRPTMKYREKTPDFQIGNKFYEMKTPVSAKAEKIEWMIRNATKQAENVMIDARKTKITEARLVEICTDRLNHIKKIKHIVLIVNSKKVIDYKK